MEDDENLIVRPFFVVLHLLDPVVYRLSVGFVGNGSLL